MIRHETITIPETTTTKIKVLCDECGAHAFTRCTECSADICVKHRYFKKDQPDGDYDHYVCAYCSEILRTSQPEINELEDKISLLLEKRELVCKENRKELNKKK